MKVPYDEGLSSHIGPESCPDARKGISEALTREKAVKLRLAEGVEGRDLTKGKTFQQNKHRTQCR